MTRKSVLVIGLVLLFSAPRLLQDFHRFLGHPYYLFLCACDNSGKTCHLEQHQEKCPICDFELIRVLADDFIVYLIDVPLSHDIIYGDIAFQYFRSPIFSVLPRSPPVRCMLGGI